MGLLLEAPLIIQPEKSDEQKKNIFYCIDRGKYQ